MKIKTLSIQNFKAFGPEQRFDFDGKNVLIYGNNGSGKSSVYYALHAFMQSSSPGKNWQKYFDPRHPDRLLNAYIDPTQVRSFVRLTTSIGQLYELSATTAPDALPSTHADIGLANLASDFMNYRLLFNFYNFRNSAEADIWDVFEKEIFPYWTYDDLTGISFEQQLVNFRQRLRDFSQMTERNSNTGQINTIGFKQPAYTTLLRELYEFNKRFAATFRVLEPEIQRLLKDYFLPDEDVQVHIRPQGQLTISYGYRYGLDWPKLQLTLTVNGRPILRPQAFMNEARLTSLALSIRLAMMGQKYTSIEGRDDLRILVLDDLLISLDMANRMKVIRYLQENFKKYQLIILTHDKGFFDILKNAFTKGDAGDEWKWFEMFDNGNSASGRNPVCIEKGDMLSKARFHLENEEHRDYEVCALYLRRKVEELLRLLYDPSLEELTRYYQQRTLFKSLEGLKTELEGKAKWQIERVLNNKLLSASQIDLAFSGGIDPSSLPHEERKLAGDALALKSNLKNMLKWHYLNREPLKQAGDDLIALCEEINGIRGRILNSGAHYNQEPVFETELRTALEKVEHLKEATFKFIKDSELEDQ